MKRPLSSSAILERVSRPHVLLETNLTFHATIADLVIFFKLWVDRMEKLDTFDCRSRLESRRWWWLASMSGGC